MKQTIITILMMLLLCVSIASATVTHTLNAPAALAEQTSTSMVFDWNATSDDTTQPPGMTTWLFLSNTSSNTPVENASFRITNTTWYNTTTLTSLPVGFYKWYLKTNDSDGNTTSYSRYFEIRDTDNQTDFRWENETGFQAMTLNKDTGDLDVTRNVIVGGNLTVLGDAIVANVTEFSVNGSIYPGLDDTFDLGTTLLTWDTAYINTIIFGNASAAILDSPTQSYLRVGDAGTADVLTTNDDLFVSGVLEVDGYAYFDSVAQINNILYLPDTKPINFGTGVDTSFLYSTIQAPDSLVLGLGADSNGFIITEKADIGVDFAQPLKTNPTLFIQSANSSDSDEFMSIEHDQTDARAVSGQGDLRLSAADNINVDRNFTMGDDSNYLLFEEQVNGTDMLLVSYQGLDIYISPSGGEIRVPSNVNVTWDTGAKIGSNTTCLVQYSPPNATGSVSEDALCAP